MDMEIQFKIKIKKCTSLGNQLIYKFLNNDKSSN